MAPEKQLTWLRDKMILPMEFFDFCQTCRTYPEIDEEKCLGCGACSDNCPCGALELKEEKKLKVRGFIGISLIGKTNYWTRP